jgi:Cu/Ag efflux protein CusF
MLIASAAFAASDVAPLATAGGKIVSIDSASNSLIVKVDKAEPAKGASGDVTFVMSDDSKIVKNAAAVALADLKAGDKVTVTYHAVDGQNVVVNIGVESKS